jgi:acyl-CoA thioesterase YciA
MKMEDTPIYKVIKKKVTVKEETTDRNIEILREGDLIMRSTWICMTKDLGVHNNAFGGILLSHVDEVAAVFAAEICDTPLMVTRSLNSEFLIPMKVGNVIKTYCGIGSIGNTSIEIIVEMRKYNLRSEAEVVCLRAKTTFVRIDEEGSAIPIYDHIKQKYNTRIKK